MKDRKAIGRMCEKTKWDELPKGIIGWILWSLPQRIWRHVIWCIGVSIAVITFLASYQLWHMRSYKIEGLRAEIFIEQWKRSERPEWKIALVNNWSEPSDIAKNIWREAAEHPYPGVRRAVAAHPWIPKYLLDRLKDDSDVIVRLSAILNRSDWTAICNFLAIDNPLCQ